ncbi:MAG: hypothetical protein ACRD38_00530 [Nitrososphaerales archaeon]
MQCSSFALLVILLLSALTNSHNTATAETEWKIYELKFDGEVIRIPYKITGADITAILAEPYSNSIPVQIDSFANGALQLKFLFESIYLYEDEFLVMVDGEDVRYKKLETTAEFMTIEIPFTKGSEIIEIIGPTIILPSPSLEQLPVFVGTDRIIDGYSLTSDRDRNMKASWESSSFIMNSNGSFALRLKLHYLSDNPTVAKVYCGECPNEQKEIDAKNIRPVGSVVFLKIEVSFTTPGPMGRHGGSNALTDLIPLAARSLDNRTAEVYYEGIYGLPKPPSKIHKLDMLSMQISWVRIFEGNDGSRYYQWMRSWEHCNGNVCESQLVPLNELATPYGSFFVYYPIPEEATRPIEVLGKDGPPYYFDYVKWIKEQAPSFVVGKLEYSITPDLKWIDEPPEWLKHLVINVINTTISSIGIDTDHMAVTVSIADVKPNASLPLKLPRELIDARENGSDSNFIVLIDRKENMNFQEINTTENYRTLWISAPVETTEIWIIGTTIIPEFSVNLMVITAIGLVGMLVASRLKDKLTQR